MSKRYSHKPPVNDIDNKFNAWLAGKLFIGVEDVFIPNAKQDVLEVIKPMITNDEHDHQAKGADQVMIDNCANLILNTNHKDAVRKTLNDRRFCIFYTPQQHVADLIRDGLTTDYFLDFISWLKNENGYAIINNALLTYNIPDEFNPAKKCIRAPETSSLKEALKMSKGFIEQELQEAIDEGRPGFCGGWVSLTHFSFLLADLRVKMSTYRKIMTLQEAGYLQHPRLKDGRVSRAIPLDNMKKSRLFIRPEKNLLELDNEQLIIDSYVKAQG